MATNEVPQWSVDNLPWSWEKIKADLTKQIVDGDIPPSMGPREVYELNHEYKSQKYENFRNNLNTLRKRLASWSKQTEADTEHLLRDRQRYAVDADGRWDGSLAQKLLDDDFAANRHADMSLDEMWKSRAEYQVFAKTKFGYHLHAMKRSAKQKPYWLARQATKKEEKEVERAKRTLKEIQKRKDAKELAAFRAQKAAASSSVS